MTTDTEWRLYLAAGLALAYVLAFRALDPGTADAPADAPVDPEPTATAAPLPSGPIWIDQLPADQLPAIALPRGWVVAPRPGVTFSAPVRAPAPRPVVRRHRLRTRSS